MSTLGRYTINPESKKVLLTSDEDQFVDELTLSKEIGYEFPHYYSGNNISGYRAAIIKVNQSNADYIELIYGITPNFIYSNKDVKHLIFYFKKSLNKFDYNRTTKALAFLYDGEAIDYHFYPTQGVKEESCSEEINEDLIGLCTKIYFYQTQRDAYQKVFTIAEYDKYLESDKIEISKVISILYGKDAGTIEDLISGIDIKHNIHKDYGHSFELVNKYYSSIEKAKKFFHDEFEIGFEDINSFDYTQSKEGVVISEGEGLFLSNIGYFTLGDKGEPKKLTDFYVKVHSKIIGTDGKHSFIVSLVNEVEGVETKKIIWENKTSPTTFSDFIQSYGPYHYHGSAPFVKELHKQISTTKQIPEIKQVIGYGAHESEGIIIFKNGVWDCNEKLFTEKVKEDEDFYYNYDASGYWVTDKQGNPLSEILSSGVPSLNINEVSELDDILDFMQELYADNSGSYLIFLAFGMMGYLAHGDQTKQFPLVFTRGITGSGKSAFNELLQRVWGITKSGTDFENSTLFTMTVTLSYLIKFPYFIAEYREAATMRLQKVGTLRSVFDKISQTKGRADQSVVKYDYVATPVLDGEEMIEDGALRTRSLQLQLLKKHKISGNFNKILRKGGGILDNILFSYLTKSSGENYQHYLDEGYDIFKPMTSQNRIAQNVASIYAGCMAFSNTEDHKGSYISVLAEIIQFQEEDVQQNSTSMQILKVMSKFMENTWNGVFPKVDRVIISWNALEDYVGKFRVNTTLKINSYKEHLLTMGFDIEYIEAGEGLIEGIVVPFDKIPKNLLVHPETYKAYKFWKDNHQKKGDTKQKKG